MLVRLLVLAIVLGIGFAVTWLACRRRGSAGVEVPSGLTLVVSQSCHLCTRASAALEATGADFRVVDVVTAGAFGISSLTVPYAVVGRGDGSVAMVRRGRSVISDACHLAAATRTSVGTE